MTFTAVLLAGGESRRMGKDKATIVFGGEPLWQRQIELLRGLRPERDFRFSAHGATWLPLDTELLLDDPPSRGPLSGLTRALERTQTSHLIALAVDMPFMTGEQLRALWGLAAIGCGVLPMIGNRAEPLAAIYPRDAGRDFSGCARERRFFAATLEPPSGGRRKNAGPASFAGRRGTLSKRE